MHGGCCDCEVVLNVGQMYDEAIRYLDESDGL
jgi:hypothetical protein